jgi:hypothetical protein
MPLPELCEDLTIDEVAEAVHNEWPGKLHLALGEMIDAQGFKIDYNVVSENR